MQRLFVCLFVVILVCFAIQANLNAQGVEYYFNLGTELYEKGEYDKAIDAFDHTLRLLDASDATHIADVKYNLGTAYEKKGEFDKAIADYSEAIRLKPKLAQAYLNRGNAWKGKREYDKAIDDYSQAMRMFDPVDTTNISYAYYNRGIAWSEKKDYDKAIADYEKALVVDPDNANFHLNRGSAREKKGEFDKALADYNQAVELAPKDAHGYNNLAWLYATCPDEKYRDGKKAVENARKASRADGGENWHCAGTLAAAFAESGDFEKAKDWGVKAVNLSSSDKSASDVDRSEARSRLELYKQGKAYRQDVKKK